MRHFQFIWLLVLFVNSAFAQTLTPEEQAKLEEAQQDNTKLVELYQKGEARKAVPYAEKAFNISKEILGETHPHTLISLNNLAIAYAEQGDLKKAIDYLEQFVKGAENLRRAQLSVENRRSVFAQYIDSYFTLSQFYFLQNNYQAAFHTAEKTKARTLLESIAFKLALQQVNFTVTDEERKTIEDQQTQLAA
jgi:tetratricopeptide (TPR) repeat protein